MNEIWKDKSWRSPICKPSFGELLGDTLVDAGIDVDKLLEEHRKEKEMERRKEKEMERRKEKEMERRKEKERRQKIKEYKVKVITEKIYYVDAESEEDAVNIVDEGHNEQDLASDTIEIQVYTLNKLYRNESWDEIRALDSLQNERNL